MKPSIRRFDKTDNMAAMVAEIRANGVAIIENLFTPEIMDELMAKLVSELNAQEPSGGDLFGNCKRSVNALFAHGAEFSDHLLLNECVLEVADGILLPDFPMSSAVAAKAQAAKANKPTTESYSYAVDSKVGPNCHHYRINATVAMQVCRGGSNQILHRDEWRYLPYYTRDPEGPELSVAIMVAASEFTEENGATRFVPGSNNWPADRTPQEHEVVQAVMPKGSIAMFLGSVYHGLGSSRVDEPRNGLIYSFVVDRMTQEENQFMAVPWELAQTLPKRAQQLIGYRASNGLNFIEVLDDPHALAVKKIGAAS